MSATTKSNPKAPRFYWELVATYAMKAHGYQKLKDNDDVFEELEYLAQ